MNDLAVSDDVYLRSTSEMRAQRYGARSHKGQYSATRILPRPYPFEKFVWKRDKPIDRIPSVSAREFGAPTRLSPQMSVNTDSQNRSPNEWRSSGEIEIDPSSKAKADALRLMPYRGQLFDGSIIRKIQTRIRQMKRMI